MRTFFFFSSIKAYENQQYRLIYWPICAKRLRKLSFIWFWPLLLHPVFVYLLYIHTYIFILYIIYVYVHIHMYVCMHTFICYFCQVFRRLFSLYGVLIFILIFTFYFYWLFFQKKNFFPFFYFIKKYIWKLIVVVVVVTYRILIFLFFLFDKHKPLDFLRPFSFISFDLSCEYLKTAKNPKTKKRKRWNLNRKRVDVKRIVYSINFIAHTNKRPPKYR